MIRNCPVCGASVDQSVEYLPENIDKAKVSGYSFASRKVPEYMSNHMVRCILCDLVYADTPPSQDELAEAYHEASYDSSEEANDAATAYINAFARYLPRGSTELSALEIGTGTAVFLQELADIGFSNLVGVEPSTAAIAAAPEGRKAWIREGIFREEDYQRESFDLIACFMTLEHVRDPQTIADASFRLLKPGGVFLSVTHDYRHFVNKVLGRRSPIVDIEHMQLFSKQSISKLFETRGYEAVEAHSFYNKYSVGYWARLFPFPKTFKNTLLSVLRRTKIGKIKLALNVGNTATVAYKPFH